MANILLPMRDVILTKTKTYIRADVLIEMVARIIWPTNLAGNRVPLGSRKTLDERKKDAECCNWRQKAPRVPMSSIDIVSLMINLDR